MVGIGMAVKVIANFQVIKPLFIRAGLCGERFSSADVAVSGMI